MSGATLMKHKYIDLEEGLILMGYGLSREKALLLMNRWCKKNWGDRMTENEKDLQAITELTIIKKGEHTNYSWKSEEGLVLGYAFKI